MLQENYEYPVIIRIPRKDDLCLKIPGAIYINKITNNKIRGEFCSGVRIDYIGVVLIDGCPDIELGYINVNS